MLRCFTLGLFAFAAAAAGAQAPCAAGAPSLEEAFARSSRAFEPVQTPRGVRYGASQPWRGYKAEVAANGAVRLGVKERSVWASLAAVGRGSALVPVAAPRSIRTGRDDAGWPKLSLDRGSVVEWFVNGREGLRQWLRVERAPAGAGPLSAKILVQGAAARSDGDDRVRLFVGDRAVLRYEGIKAWDAQGVRLPARLIGNGAAIRLEVDDRNAAYPVTIDPVWLRDDALVASDLDPGDAFSGAVAVKGKLAVVGAPAQNSGTGAAYVFERDACGCWDEKAKLAGSGTSANDNFGSSVATDGVRIAVGAPGAVDDPGSAFVFERDGGGGWVEAEKLLASDAAPANEFGTSVSLQGDDLAVGSPGNCQIYLFSRGTSWGQMAVLPSPDASPSAFGFSVDLDGDRLLAGDPMYALQGRAYVFDRVGPTQWSLRNAFDADTPQFLGYFGFSVSLSGNRALVGQPEPSGNGAAQVFAASDDASPFLFEQALTPTGGVLADSQFGQSVALDGARAVVGAPGANADAGTVYVFQRSVGGWTMAAELVEPSLDPGEQYGYAVALDGYRVVVGAPGYVGSGVGFVWEGPHLEFHFAEAGRTGGKRLDFLVDLMQPAPTGGVEVFLSSSHPGVLSLPASVTIPEGVEYLRVSGMASVVATDTPVEITGTAAEFDSVVGNVVIRSPRVGRIDVPVTRMFAGQTTYGTIVLNGTSPAGGTLVSLSSNAALEVPATVTVPAGETRATFPIVAQPVTTTTEGTVSATPALSPKTARITVNEGLTPNVSLQYGVLAAGEVMSGTVTLSEPAPAGGVVVQLTSSGPIATPSSVSIAEGQRSAAFRVTSEGTTGLGVVDATLGAIVTEAKVQVQKMVLLSVDVSPETVVGGLSFNFGVTLEKPAPPSGVTVYMSTPDPHVVNLPSTVFIPAGQTRAVGIGITSFVRNPAVVAVVGRVAGGGNRGAYLTLAP